MAKAKRTPAFASAAAVADLFLPPSLRWASSLQRLVLLEQRPLAVLLLGRDLGLLGEVEPEDDRDLLGLEPVDDLAGLAAADDHGRGAELLGQVERPVDLVAGVGLPPDRQLPLSGPARGPASAGS